MHLQSSSEPGMCASIPQKKLKTSLYKGDAQRGRVEVEKTN